MKAVQTLAAEFIPAADEVGRLQRGGDPESKVFQGIMEFGHYGGRTQPTNTRQGIYMLTPSGKFLASINSNDPNQMLNTMRRALGVWAKLSRADRLRSAEVPGKVGRFEEKYPVDGLNLRVITRDLVRPELANDWRANAWNIDFAWFRAEEAASLVPTSGDAAQLAERPWRRLVRLHMIDTVRGQAPPYADNLTLDGALTSRVTNRSGTKIELRLGGTLKLEEKGVWSVHGYQDMNTPSPNRRGMNLNLRGDATWDTEKRRFTSFELVAAGDRWGATQYNGRHDDQGPAPIGFLLSLAGDSPSERVAPANWWGYGW